MSQMMTQSPVVQVKPQANVYTVLLIIAVLAMAAAVGTLMVDLTQNYGMEIGEIFSAGSTAAAK